MISETEILDQLQNGIEFPPLTIRLSRTFIQSARDDGVDALLEVDNGEESYEFATKLKARSTPRAFDESLRQMQQVGSQEYFPMLVVPYLREKQLEELQQRQLSGIDLSGNGVICVPGKLLVYRTGKPNKYPDSAPTKYAYRGTTSLVARTFLCRRTFESLTDIEEEIKTRDGSIAISTVSKALKRLESDLIVDRTEAGYRLRQSDKLLEQLSASYREPKVTRTATLSMKQPIEKLIAAAGKKTDLVLTGRSSVDAYAVMGRDEYPVLYTTNIDRLLKQWASGVEETSRFVELELRQTGDQTVYFDSRIKQDLPYASPVQAFLELSAGDKREREVAEQVRDSILRALKE